MRILTFTTLYPNAMQAHHGIFVEQRLRRVCEQGGFEARVVAPVPWFPFDHPRFADYAKYARVPRFEQRAGFQVRHPRYLTIPKLGMTLAPFLLAAASIVPVRNVQAENFDFELIDAHYFYPDGVAAAWLARRLGKPLVITARGTDINLIPRYAMPRRMIQWAARRAAAIVAVCQALKDTLVELGVPADKVTVLRNGVDLEMFRPPDRCQARARLGLKRRTILSVGWLIERKGHHLVIEALRELPDVDLLIVGSGEEERRLRRLAAVFGVEERVRFVGAIAQPELKDYYGAADALVLASSREGWANVLLESMACGTPVVATNVWGTPEVVSAPEAGVLVAQRTATAIAAGVREVLARRIDRAATRRYAEGFSWDATAEGQRALFRRVAGAGAG